MLNVDALLVDREEKHEDLFHFLILKIAIITFKDSSDTILREFFNIIKFFF